MGTMQGPLEHRVYTAIAWPCFRHELCASRSVLPGLCSLVCAPEKNVCCGHLLPQTEPLPFFRLSEPESLLGLLIETQILKTVASPESSSEHGQDFMKLNSSSPLLAFKIAGLVKRLPSTVMAPDYPGFGSNLVNLVNSQDSLRRLRYVLDHDFLKFILSYITSGLQFPSLPSLPSPLPLPPRLPAFPLSPRSTSPLLHLLSEENMSSRDINKIQHIFSCQVGTGQPSRRKRVPKSWQISQRQPLSRLLGIL